MGHPQFWQDQFATLRKNAAVHHSKNCALMSQMGLGCAKTPDQLITLKRVNQSLAPLAARAPRLGVHGAPAGRRDTIIETADNFDRENTSTSRRNWS